MIGVSIKIAPKRCFAHRRTDALTRELPRLCSQLDAIDCRQERLLKLFYGKSLSFAMIVPSLSWAQFSLLVWRPKCVFSHLSAKRDSSARSTLTGGRLLSRPRRLWRWRTACSRGRSHRSLTQNAPRFSTVLHLSRACLGKLIGFNLMGMAQKGVRSFSAPRFFAKLA